MYVRANFRKHPFRIPRCNQSMAASYQPQRVCSACSLCIVGAGYAGINALNAASKYLKPGDKVVIVDKNHTWGGQWIEQVRA